MTGTATAVTAAPRVLLCGRPDLLTKPGGDTRQILGLLQHLGPSASLGLELQPRLAGIDVVHLFNLSRPVEPAVQAEHARRSGRPVVCTTIFQDLAEYNRRGRHGAGRALFRLLGRQDSRLETVRALVNLSRAGRRAVLHGLPMLARLGATGLQARILENCALLVFNSSLEEETVRRCVPIPSRPPDAAVVPVGIEPDEIAPVDPRPFLEGYGIEPGFVLSVGRIEDLKNQLGLIRALQHAPLPLVLVGAVNPLHRAYARAVARAAAARPRTLLLHRIERPLVLSAMAAAAVHVLPSWFETAGLASLEAAAAGCAVVSTDRGYARAYLEEDASYCDPSDPASIRQAVERALGRGPSARLRQRVTARFTAANSARAMADLYRQVAA